MQENTGLVVPPHRNSLLGDVQGEVETENEGGEDFLMRLVSVDPEECADEWSNPDHRLHHV